MKKDEYHEVPGVLLYSFHFASQRENESCIDETSEEAPELHFLLALWLLRNSSASGVHFMIARSTQKGYFVTEVMETWVKIRQAGFNNITRTGLGFNIFS